MTGAAIEGVLTATGVIHRQGIEIETFLLAIAKATVNEGKGYRTAKERCTENRIS